MRHSWFASISLLILATLMSGCTALVSSKLTDDLSHAILNQDDPETVREGAPAYLLLIDGLIEGSPRNAEMLKTGAKLYATYAAVFVEDTERAKRLAAKAYAYAQRQLCIKQPALCDIRQQPYDDFKKSLIQFELADVPELYTYATAWAVWIQTRSSDWQALAELPKVEAMLERVVALDENYEQGQSHVYLGIIGSALPANMGGKPEQGRKHFERAIALSQGRNLIAKVEYARHYARLVFDKALHDRLLQEVMAADPVVPGFTLSNTLAQQGAKRLLESSADYFLD